MNSKKAASLIGLSMKAGKIASGEFATEKAVKQGTAYLVVTAVGRLGQHEEEIRKYVCVLSGTASEFPDERRAGKGYRKGIPGLPCGAGRKSCEGNWKRVK